MSHTVVATATIKTLKLTQRTNNRIPAIRPRIRARSTGANPTGQVLAAQQAQELVQQVLDITIQQNDNTMAELVVQDVTDDDIARAVGQNATGPLQIGTTTIRQNARAGNLGNTAATQALGGLPQLNPNETQDLEARVVRAQRNNFEQAAIQSANNDTTEDPPPGCISRNCGKIALGIISVILVAALLKLFHVYSGGTDLGYVAHPPGNKPEDPEDDPNDKEIVEQFNVAAKAYGVDISSPFTKAQVKPLLKEAYDWFWMSEEAFWKTKSPREVEAPERCAPKSLMYQIISLSSLIPHALQKSIFSADFVWIDPKDPQIITATLVTIYQEKGVDAMYDFISTYKYYKSPLRRVVAIEVVVNALLKMLPAGLKVQS